MVEIPEFDLERKKNGNGNGVKAVWVRIIEMLIMSAIVGGITLWGNSRVFETKISHMCDDLNYMRNDINKMMEKFERHMENWHFGGPSKK